MKIKKIFDKIRDKNVIIIGDSMVDSYVMGEVKRNSPEAPVPIVDVIDENIKLGGAANVALNLKSLGMKPILISVVGDDHDGKNLIKLLKEENLERSGIIVDSSRKTTNKKRVIVDEKHLLRIDDEDTYELSVDSKKNLLKKINRYLEKTKIIIFQDYNKGVIDKEIIKNVISHSSDKFISVDPKKNNFFHYKNVNLFKPNRKEISDAYKYQNASIEDIIYLSSKIKDENNIENIMITLSKDGLILNNGIAKHHKTKTDRIVDVSGAGDTVISLATILFSEDLPEKFIAEMCNLAGGMACMNSGVTAINLEELIKNAERNNLDLYL